MKTKEQQTHTPGPWVLRNRTIYGPSISGRIVTLHSGWEGINTPEEFNANARLIVAAPELLKIAQMVVEWAKTSGTKTTMEHRMAQDALDAIAKATGEI